MSNTKTNAPLPSDKLSVQLLVKNCIALGIKHYVVSPGSRNAPIVLTLNASKEANCYKGKVN